MIPPETIETSAILIDESYEELKKDFDQSTNNIRLIYRRASDIQTKPINWLWEGRIARGKVSLLVGNPGLGKSQLSAYMAAIVTTGGLWPVDKTLCQRGGVIFLSAEDSPEDTIVPRLKAVGANLKLVNIIDAVSNGIDPEGNPIPKHFNLATDLQRLDELLLKLNDVALIVIDPISAYLGDTDSHRTADVRALLSPLSKLAEKHNVAIVGVSHLNKGNSNEALMRVTGSLGFVAAARAAYVITKDNEDETKRLLLPIKNNLGNDTTGLAFTIESCQLIDGIKTSRVKWLDETITKSADEVMTKNSSDDKNAVNEAKEFLIEQLSYGSKSAKEIRKDAEDAGHSWRTVERAKYELGIKSKKEGFSKKWVWSLPPKTANYPEGRQEKSLAVFDKVDSSQQVVCVDCRHFNIDQIGNGSGIGSCKINAWVPPQPLLYPKILRNCDRFSFVNNRKNTGDTL